MKKLTNKIFIRVTSLLGAFVLAGAVISCGNIASGDEASNQIQSQKAYLSVSLKDGARSALVPTDVSESDITKAVLNATLKGETEAKELAVWESSGSKSAIQIMEEYDSIEIATGTYSFTLSLYVTMNGTPVLCQEGSIEMQIVPGKNKLDFMSTYVQKSIGNFSLSLSFAKSSYIESIEVDLNRTDIESETVYTYKKEESANLPETITASYAKTGLETGIYEFTIKVYGLEPSARAADDKDPVNTFSKMVIIGPGCTTSASISLENINTIYEVNLVYPSDTTFSEDYSFSKSRNKSQAFVLPSARDMSIPGKFFCGWFDNEKFEGEPCTYIPSGKAGDLTYHAKWSDKISIKAEQIPQLPELLSRASGTITVEITDKIELEELGQNWLEDAIVYDKTGKIIYKYTNPVFKALAQALSYFEYSGEFYDENDDYVGTKIKLDLSKTGITYLPTNALVFVEEVYGGFGTLDCLTEVILPSNLEALLPNSLWGSGLSTIEIPKNVTYIGKSAFEKANLESITIPAGVTQIDNFAFGDCDKLTAINFAEGSKLKSIGSGAFYCSNLKSITIPAGVTEIREGAFGDCDKLTAINFEEGSKLESIGDSAFTFCSTLESITIPASVSEIGNDAFYKCSSLTAINFAGTKEQWGKVTKGDNWHKKVPATVIICSDDETVDLDYTVPDSSSEE